MADYTLDVLSCHQRDILLLIYARYPEDYIGFFLRRSFIQKLIRVCCKKIHVTALVLYYLFLRSSLLGGIFSD